ncbi:MAG: hypothetical protein JJ869_06150 [Marivita sp.]|nr:hypothetical protein [Marivita sp.]
MMSIAGCWKRRLAALAIVTSLQSGCAMVGSSPPFAIVCPPVVEYSRETQSRVAEELSLLPDSSTIAEMLSDYVVMREQSRACE